MSKRDMRKTGKARARRASQLPRGTKKTTAETTARRRRVGELIPQAHGGALRNGGTNKGGPGRPPNWLKEWCDEQLADPKTLNAIRAALRNHKHPAFPAMVKLMMERGHGKPPQSVDLRVTRSYADILRESMDEE